MKSKDIMIIVGVVIVSSIFSYVVSKALFGGEKTYTLTAPKVEVISQDFVLPDERYFNSNSLNPTKTITIGDSTNTQPF